jgi:hypothetical protein
MSFSLGRPFTLDASEITVPWPSLRREGGGRQHETWGSTSQVPNQHDFVALITKKRIHLCDIVEPIARALLVLPYPVKLLKLTYQRYSNAAIASKTLQELSESATRAMTSWEQDLPNSLRLDNNACEVVPPQVLVLQ